MKTVKVYSSVEHVMDTTTSTKIKILDGDYHALVSEVVDEKGQVQGTCLYVPGVRYHDLRS